MNNLLLHNIIKIDVGNKFFQFSNADGKMWIIPIRNMSTAMNLYQPSGIKGKLMKRLYPYLFWSNLASKAIHAKKKSCILRQDFQKLLSNIFGEDFEFSVFGGTPGVHQKITMQLNKGKKILGYCKLSNNTEIVNLFFREASTLALLSRFGMENRIPRVLYCGFLNDSIGLFIQSTDKTVNSRVVHKWSNLHDEFINHLQQATRKTLMFEESDFYQTLFDLRTHLEWLPEWVNKEIINNQIEAVFSTYSGRRVTFSAYHADFTPWNMFVENDRLFVFDFEYARLTYPEGLDRYHFFTQTAIFEKHWQSKEIISFLKTSESYWVDKKKYICYLLDIISRFTLREKGFITKDIEKSFSIWIDILNYLSVTFPKNQTVLY